MNSKVSITKSIRNKDSRLFLADKENLDWLPNYFEPAEISFIKNTVKSNISYVFVPDPSRLSWIYFLTPQENTNSAKEEARIAGNEILPSLAHYKVTCISVLCHCNYSRLLEYVEGMVLGNYQFLKYYHDKKDRANSLKDIRIVSTSVSRKDVNDLNALLGATCIARDLVNEPLSYLTAITFSKKMKALGKFLEHFTDYEWLHFDIAGPAFLKTADAYRSKDGTGVGVRLLFDFLKNY